MFEMASRDPSISRSSHDRHNEVPQAPRIALLAAVVRIADLRTVVLRRSRGDVGRFGKRYRLLDVRPHVGNLVDQIRHRDSLE